MGKYRRFLAQELVEKTCSLGMGLYHHGWDGLEWLRWEAGNQFENYNNSPHEKSWVSRARAPMSIRNVKEYKRNDSGKRCGTETAVVTAWIGVGSELGKRRKLKIYIYIKCQAWMDVVVSVCVWVCVCVLYVCVGGCVCVWREKEGEEQYFGETMIIFILTFWVWDTSRQLR